MEREKYELIKAFPINQMHDEIINSILAQDDRLEIDFAELIHPNLAWEKCKMVFYGLDDVDSDFRAFVYDINTDLSLRGELFYFNDFIDKFVIKGRPIMEVIEICCGNNNLIIRGVLLKKSGYLRKNIVIQIYAKELIYIWS